MFALLFIAFNKVIYKIKTKLMFGKKIIYVDEL